MANLDENYSSGDSISDEEFVSEMDVPGASLNGREVSLRLKIPKLKRWLQCRRAPTMGKKADLVGRLIINSGYTV